MRMYFSTYILMLKIPFETMSSSGFNKIATKKINSIWQLNKDAVWLIERISYLSLFHSSEVYIDFIFKYFNTSSTETICI